MALVRRVAAADLTHVITRRSSWSPVPSYAMSRNGMSIPPARMLRTVPDAMGHPRWFGLADHRTAGFASLDRCLFGTVGEYFF